MLFRFRTALMWLLLLALPLQGFAAVTMINCGPNHHRMASAVVTDTPDTHEHASADQHHHPAEVVGDHHDAASKSNDAPRAHHLDTLTKFKCSACAACCLGAALPTAVFAFKASPPAIAPDSLVATKHVGFVTDGPDRPPRLCLV